MVCYILICLDISSATINTQRFAQFFPRTVAEPIPAPIVRLRVRLHRVEITHEIAPVPERERAALAVRKAISVIESGEPGDVLIFASGKVSVFPLD